MIKTDYTYSVVAEGEEEYSVDSFADLEDLLPKDDKDKEKEDDDVDDDDDSDDTDDSDDDTDDEPGDDQDDDQDDDDDSDDDDTDDEDSDNDDSKEKKKTKKPPKEKDHKAFAAMRLENSRLGNEVGLLKEQLKQLAMGLGLKTDNEADMMEQLGQAALRGRAKKENKTPEQIAQDNATQAELMRLRTEDVKRHTFAEIGEIKKLGATDDEIRDLVTQLANEGKNPFQTKQELKALYISRNYDTLMERERQAAVEKALKRDNAADKNSSKSKKKGKKDSDNHVINDMAELDKVLDSL